ncbi:MAG: phosphoenolpyruvate--protein phosphotransferase [Balneola sp.]|nr:phosphoenolpyruvate--protein phosphotransferase [Balneola sp.]|tara:strand:- start:138605 stop:140329 length:1725 start_codon:yes stop_codon:yes gene_type:complete
MNADIADTKEKHFNGRGVGVGVGIGKSVVIDIESAEVEPNSISEKDVETHKKKFSKANKGLTEELELLAKELTDKSTREIIEAQLQIIQDPEIEKSVSAIIEEKLLTVEYAIYSTYCKFIERLKESGSELFKQRIVDLEDIRDRLIAIVCNHTHKHPVKKGDVVVAKDISPTELVAFYEKGMAGLVMEKGGPTSHAAIIAKSLGLPCVVSVKKATKNIDAGEQLILDSESGMLICHPDKETLKSYRKKQKDRLKLSARKCREVFETKDGHPYQLLANIEFEAELPKVAEHGARGIGLLRTESLLFGSRIRKGQEDQEVFYSHILEGTEGPVTIRLFDVGGDKTTTRASKEDNPFLGWRGIRLLLDEKQLLQNQLKAILKVSGKYPGRIKVLVPMVSVMDEVDSIKKELEEAREAVTSEGYAVDEGIQLGLMVEVPSVAISARKFAREVDFLSIGTNDLTQYTMAVDRGNERISALFQHYHPSVLQLIKTTQEGATEEGADLSVCGELAGDPVGVAFLIGAGISDLSMLPHSIPEIADLLSSFTKKEFEAFAESALNSSSDKQVKELFEKSFCQK